MIRKLNIQTSDANDAELQGLRLHIYYDQSNIPAIDIPVGNFFGAGKQRAKYKSIPLGTDSADGFYCYWPMPFRTSMTMQLSNSINTPISIDSAIIQYEPDINTAGMCYFHAAETSSTKQPSHTYHQILSTNGRGHYVGNLLYIEQDSFSFYIFNI